MKKRILIDEGNGARIVEIDVPDLTEEQKTAAKAKREERLAARNQAKPQS